MKTVKTVKLNLDDIRRACIEYAIRYKGLEVYRGDTVRSTPSHNSITMTVEVESN